MRLTGITVAIGCVTAIASVAHGNGRFPASTNVAFQPGSDARILLGVTFGLVLSEDDGASFRWVCEDAVGYGGTFDPDYAVAASGRIYATTFSGVRYSDDGGCSFSDLSGPVASPAFVNEVEVGPDGRVWAATATSGAPNDVYRSDDGLTFEPAGLAEAETWWRTIRIAPSDGDRIYVTGLDVPVGTSTAARLEVSTNGGTSWTTLPLGDFAFGPQPDLFVEGVMPDDPDVVFVRVRGARQPVGDDIYRSGDGGQTWQKVLEMGDTITAFAVRANGDVIAGSIGRCTGDAVTADKGCVRISTDRGLTFEPAATEPKMACVGERSDGVLFACGANWEPDNFAIGRSTDGQTWQTAARFSALDAKQCPTGTPQEQCEALNWPSLCINLGVCTSDDAGPDAGITKHSSDGWCSTSARPGELLFVLVVLAATFGLRRRRPPPADRPRSPRAR